MSKQIKNIDQDAIYRAAQVIESGGVLAYPTESVWGLGCDPFNEEAFRQLLSLKNRPQEKGVILIAGSINQVQPYLKHLPHDMQQQIASSWNDQLAIRQGATWLVSLENGNQIPSWVTGMHDSVALRVTPHPLVQQLCQAVGSCLVSTSCNLAGGAPATTQAEALGFFSDSVSYLFGDTLGFDKPSRILDAKTGAILRK